MHACMYAEERILVEDERQARERESGTVSSELLR